MSDLICDLVTIFNRLFIEDLILPNKNVMKLEPFTTGYLFFLNLIGFNCLHFHLEYLIKF